MYIVSMYKYIVSMYMLICYVSIYTLVSYYHSSQTLTYQLTTNITY